MGSQNEDFDALLKKTWDEGIKTDDLVYKSFKSIVAVDGDIPFEARYLPSLGMELLPSIFQD